jgi:hypothetical protein
MGSTKAAANLPGYGSPSAAGYFNNQMTASRMLGLAPGSGSKAAGHTLPPTSHQAGDRAVVWWHPDSPQFWLIAFGATALLGVSGLSFRVRAGPARAGASVGKS